MNAFDLLEKENIVLRRKLENVKELANYFINHSWSEVQGCGWDIFEILDAPDDYVYKKEISQ